MTKINRRQVKVKVGIEGDQSILVNLDKAIDAAERSQRRKAKAAAKAAAAAAPPPPGTGFTMQPGPPPKQIAGPVSTGKVAPIGGGPIATTTGVGFPNGGAGGPQGGGGGSGGGGYGGGEPGDMAFFGAGNKYKTTKTVRMDPETGKPLINISDVYGGVDEQGRSLNTTVSYPKGAKPEDAIIKQEIVDEAELARIKNAKKNARTPETMRLTDQNEQDRMDREAEMNYDLEQSIKAKKKGDAYDEESVTRERESVIKEKLKAAEEAKRDADREIQITNENLIKERELQAKEAERYAGKERQYDLTQKLAEQEQKAKEAEKAITKERESLLNAKSEAIEKARKDESAEAAYELNQKAREIKSQQAKQDRIANEKKKLGGYTAERVNVETDLVLRQGFSKDPTVQTAKAPLRSDPTQFATSEVHKYTKALADGSEMVYRYDTATGKLTPSINRSTQAYRDNAKTTKLAAAETQAAASVRDLEANGFKLHTETLKKTTIAGKEVTTTVKELRRVSGSGVLGNLQVEVAKVDSSTGKLTQRTVKANEALRMLGDSFGSAVGKVSLWLAATSAVFLFSRAVQFGVSQMKELEANTVFLARVGSNLGSQNAGFSERYAEAKLLTEAIIEQSKALGVDAVASQRAASVFLRAGQDRKQALESTRAAMVASRIAELDVAEAAQLLSAAQTQFNLKSKDLMPTLDTLNSLSNKYRVSTDDLLQSISRSGSVYAEANGQLSELAAVTAVTAQVTSRSGAEIGNAIKTIQARLSSNEISGDILESTGISMRDAAGNAKSYVKILLQLQAAMTLATAAERSRLPVTVAGARQVNILKSQMDNVIEIVIAEARALRDGASANKEAAETAITLESALLRLQAAFTGAVADSGKVIFEMISAFTGLLNIIGAVVSYIPNILIQLALFIGVSLVVKVLINKLTAAYISNAASLGALVAAQLAATGSTGAFAAALALLQVAFGPVMLAAMALTAVVATLIYVFGEVERSTASSAIAAQQHADAIENEVNAANKKMQAMRQLGDAMQEQLALQLRINQARIEGKPVDEKEAAKVQANIKRLAGKDGLDLPGVAANGATTDAKVVAASAAVNRKFEQEKIDNQVLLNKQLEAQIKLEEQKKLAVRDAEDKLMKQTAQYQEQVKLLKIVDDYIEKQREAGDARFQWKEGESIEEQRKKQRGMVSVKPSQADAPITYGFSGDTPIAGDVMAAAVESTYKVDQGLIDKLTDELAKLTKESGDASAEVFALKARIEELKSAKIPPALTEEILKAGRAAKDGDAIFKRFQNSSSMLGKIGGDTAATETQNQTKQLENLSVAQDQVAKYVEALKDNMDDPAYKEYSRRLIEITTAMEGLNAAAAQTRIKNFNNYFKEKFKGVDVEREAAKQDARLNDIRNPLKGGGERFEGIRDKERDIQLYKQQAQTALKARNDIKPANFGSKEEYLAASQALEENATDSMAKARELELGIVSDILEVERDIVKERQNQNKETMKALGLLSDEEKLDVLHQAAFFKKNPGRKVTAEEQFFSSSGQNQMMQNFFGGHLDTAFDPADPFSAGLMAAGIGPQNEQLDAAEKEHNARMAAAGGRDALIAKQKKEAADLLDQETRARGQQVPLNNGPSQFNLDLSGMRPPVSAADFAPLITSFENAVAVEVIKVRDELIKEVQRIWDRVEAIPGMENQLPSRGL